MIALLMYKKRKKIQWIQISARASFSQIKASSEARKGGGEAQCFPPPRVVQPEGWSGKGVWRGECFCLQVISRFVEIFLQLFLPLTVLWSLVFSLFGM